MSSFQLLPALEGPVACLTCGAGARAQLPLDWDLEMGFGAGSYSRDGVVLWEEHSKNARKTVPTVADVEALALADPDHDWRIQLISAYYDAEYQRQGPGQWVLVRKDEGIA
jgi:hypothetical protein